MSLAVCSCLLVAALNVAAPRLDPIPDTVSDQIVTPYDQCNPHPDDAYWSDAYGPPERSEGVSALASNGDELYVAGEFSHIGGRPFRNIAFWDGAAWNAMGEGICGSVRGLVYTDLGLLAVGDFYVNCQPTIQNAALWNDGSWNQMGAELPVMLDGTSYGDTIYTISSFKVFRYDGVALEQVARIHDFYGLDGPADLAAIEADSVGNLYVGGRIGYLAEPSQVTIASNVMFWDHASWRGLGFFGEFQCGVLFPFPFYISRVDDIDIRNGSVYVVGSFPAISTLNTPCAGRWDGSRWHALSASLQGACPETYRVLKTENDIAWTGGVGESGNRADTTTIGGVVASARRATVFAELDGGVVAGFWDSAPADNPLPMLLGLWNGTSWTDFAPGMENREGFGFYGYVRDIFIEDDTVYAAGQAIDPGTSGVGPDIYRGVFKREGGSWSALRPFDDPAVFWGVISFRGSYYACGETTEDFGDGHEHHIVRYQDGNAYPLSSGLDGLARVMVKDGNLLYVGGDFSTAGGVSSRGVAAWDGTNWIGLDGGVDDRVFDLAIFQGNLYASGKFTQAGGAPISGVAKWDGDAWSQMGTPLDGYVRSLVFAGNQLFVADCNDPGGCVRTLVDGNWQLVGSFDNYVHALAFTESGWLYAAGAFQNGDGQELSRVARFDGQKWLPLGSGVNDEAYDIETLDDHVFLAGRFTRAGTRLSVRFAEWIEPAPAPIEVPFLNVSTGTNEVQLSWAFASTLPIATIHVDRRDVSNGDIVRLVSLPSDATGYTDTSFDPGRTYEYSLVAQRHDGSTEKFAAQAIPARMAFSLNQNVPNPFNPTTMISFVLRSPEHVRLDIFDASGRPIVTLLDGPAERGLTTVQWDGRNRLGEKVASGVYVYRIEAGSNAATRKMVLVR